ncbi:hypothetical protein FD754_025455, partial [Muntiacus muntjak]
LLGLVLPSASAQALSYREAVLRAVDQLNEQSSEPNIYRLIELDQPPQDDEDPDTPKQVSFRVKETVCSRTSQQPPEQCDFKENGLLKRCEGTVTLDQVRGNFDITCNNRKALLPCPLPPRAPGLQSWLCVPKSGGSLLGSPPRELVRKADSQPHS